MYIYVYTWSRPQDLRKSFFRGIYSIKSIFPIPNFGVAILVFFFVVSRFLLLLVKNQKNLEKTKKTTQVLPRPAPLWFCFFGFLEVFATFGQKNKKNARKKIEELV